MSNDDSMLNLSKKSRLSAEVTFLMLKGAGYAAVFVLGIWLVIAIIQQIGLALPDASRENPDPINRSGVDISAPLAAVV